MRRPRIALAALIGLVLLSAGSLYAQSGTFGDSDRQQPRSYQLTVTSNVRGAEIYIDGVRQRGTAPETFNLRPGTYTVRVEARGYESWQARVTLNSNQSIHANLIPPTATVLLRIPSELLNDRVRDPWRLIDFYLDGRLRTESRIEVDPGYHDVTLVSGGLQLNQEYYFEAGRFYTFEFFMELSRYPRDR